MFVEFFSRHGILTRGRFREEPLDYDRKVHNHWMDGELMTGVSSTLTGAFFMNGYVNVYMAQTPSQLQQICVTTIAKALMRYGSSSASKLNEMVQRLRKYPIQLPEIHIAGC